MSNVVWMMLVEDKYLTWVVRIALLLATIVSAVTMPLEITLLLAAACAVLLVAVKKSTA